MKPINLKLWTGRHKDRTFSEYEENRWCESPVLFKRGYLATDGAIAIIVTNPDIATGIKGARRLDRDTEKLVMSKLAKAWRMKRLRIELPPMPKSFSANTLTVGDARYQARYLRMVKAIQGVRVYAPYRDDEAMKFRFTGGHGYVMPCKPW
jgi:hypothetical protein